MYQLATTLVSVLRGTTTNAWGDVVDTADVHQSGIPAALDEQMIRAFDGATQQPRVVRLVLATLPGATDVLDTDRLLDERSGVTYAVEAVLDPHVPGRTADVLVQLRRVT